MAMQVSPSREGEPTSEINTTPLIDVMLVLLIMLIITLPPQRHAVELDTPIPCDTCEEKERPDPIRIAVDLDGSFTWDGQPVTSAELQQRLRIEARRAEQPEIHIAPSRRAEYGRVAHVMAAAQREGLKRMGVINAS